MHLVTEQGRQPTEVAKELGICIDTLRSWLKSSSSGIQMGQVSRQNRERQRIRELEAKNHALRKQLGAKEEIINILKIRRHPVETIQEKYRCSLAVSR